MYIASGTFFSFLLALLLLFLLRPILTIVPWLGISVGKLIQKSFKKTQERALRFIYHDIIQTMSRFFLDKDTHLEVGKTEDNGIRSFKGF